MRRLKHAVIGCGRISKNHLEAINNNKDMFELVALCDIVPERIEDRKKLYLELDPEANINLYKSYEEMIEKEDLDSVIISTESGYHGQIALKCLEKGLHVLIEKPMALDLDEIDKINALAKEKDLVVEICHQNRFNAPIQKLKRAVDDNRFGKMTNVTARILWNRNQHYYDLAPWRGTRALDGGTLMNQCIHNIDLLQWMVGSPVKSVKAELDTFLRDIEMEDFGAIVIRFENGVIGIVEGSACVYPKNLEETLSVFGETGTVVIGGLAVNKIETWDFEDSKYYDNIETKESIDNVYGNGHTPLYKDFYSAVVEGTEPLISGVEGKKAVEIILRAYEESGIYDK